MDLFNDVKMLVLLLGFLSSTCGRPTGLQNQGYNYNVQQQPSSLDKILKAVLVHESTGQGVHSGSDAGASFKVANQNGYRVGQSASTGYLYSAKTGLQNIRVFHKSHGDTGYNQPQAAREAPRGFGATSKVDPDEALKSIHDSLFRPRSDQKIGHGQSSFGSSSFAASSPNAGFRYESSKQPDGYFYGAGSGFGGGPAQTVNRGFGGDNLRNTGGSPASGYQYPSPVQNQNTGFATENLSNTGSGYPSNGYQYPSPVQNQNTGFASENLSNGGGSSVEAAQSNSAQAPNGGSAFENNGYSGSSQNGYQYSGQNRGSGSPPVTPSNGYQYTRPAQAPTTEGYRYEKPASIGYTYEKPAEADQVAISQFVSSLAQLNSENQGYRYEKPIPAQSIAFQHGSTGSDGYQYPAPPQLEEAPHQFEQPSNSGYNFNTPLQADVAPHQFAEHSNSGFNGFSQNFHNSKPFQNDGYHYDQPQKPDSAKSVFKGQPYLPLPPAANNNGYQYESPSRTNGYRYDRPDESSRPKTVFKGQSYLPIPPVSGGL